MLKIIELFGGIGACTTALKRLNIPFQIQDYVEIDKYAVASYNAINGTNFEPQDITLWDKDIEVDLIMHGSPCQDISVAGKQAGADEGSGTRSSLMYETLRIVDKLKPKVVIWENVKNLISKKHKPNFDNYIERMNKLGYNSYYQVLDAKDYGIPQHRERVYTISIRKDFDNGTFKFPKKQQLKLRLKDILEQNVDEKYYLSQKQIDRIYTTTYNVGKTRIQNKDYSDTLCARDWKDPKCVRIGGIYDTETSKHQAGSIYDINKIDIPCKVKVRKYPVDIDRLVQILRNAKLDIDITNREIAKQLNIPVTQVEHYFRTDKSFAIPDENIWLKLKDILHITTNDFDESIMTFEEKDGVYEKSNRVYLDNGVSPTLSTSDEIKIIGKENYGTVTATNQNLRIRKLTPKECWRLMGFNDYEFELAEKMNSNSQLYKQAGNSIVVNVLVEIFRNLI